MSPRWCRKGRGGVKPGTGTGLRLELPEVKRTRFEKPGQKQQSVTVPELVADDEGRGLDPRRDRVSWFLGSEHLLIRGVRSDATATRRGRGKRKRKNAPQGGFQCPRAGSEPSPDDDGLIG